MSEIQYDSVQRRGKRSAQSAPDEEGYASADHGSTPHIDKAPVGTEDRRSQTGKERVRYKKTNTGGIQYHKNYRPPKSGHIQILTTGIGGQIFFYRREAHQQISNNALLLSCSMDYVEQLVGVMVKSLQNFWTILLQRIK
jgi:hypothetical protein